MDLNKLHEDYTDQKDKIATMQSMDVDAEIQNDELWKLIAIAEQIIEIYATKEEMKLCKSE